MTPPPTTTDSSSVRQTRYRSTPAHPGSISLLAPHQPRPAASPPLHPSAESDHGRIRLHTWSECLPCPADPWRPTECHVAVRDNDPPQSRNLPSAPGAALAPLST